MKSQEEQRQLVFFLAGFLIGVLYIYFVEVGWETDDFLGAQSLVQIACIEIEPIRYFWYVLKKRLIFLLALWGISFALLGKQLLLGIVMLYGCGLGSMLSMLVVKYKLKGIGIFLGLLFPQHVVYLPLLFGWVYYFVVLHERNFARKGNYGRKPFNGRGFGNKCLKLGGVTIIGILLECYVNPIIIKLCLKIF